MAEREESALRPVKGINRTNDYAFKRILGSEEGKEALLGFLNAVLQPPSGRELTELELVDRELDPAYLLDRGARLDVLARTAAGVIINVEVQVANRYDTEKRTLFYWARLYQGQLSAGQKFRDLHKTVVINVLGFNLFPEDAYHNVFRLREDLSGRILCDDLEMHFLELDKVKKLGRRPANPLEAWLMYLNNLEGEELEAIAVENPAIRKAMTIEEMFHKSALERRLYELREKAILDELSMMDGARTEGRAEGETIGVIKAKQDDIVKFMATRFKVDPSSVQEKVRPLTDLKILDEVLTQLFAADSAESAMGIISDAASEAVQ